MSLSRSGLPGPCLQAGPPALRLELDDGVHDDQSVALPQAGCQVQCGAADGGGGRTAGHGSTAGGSGRTEAPAPPPASCRLYERLPVNLTASFLGPLPTEVMVTSRVTLEPAAAVALTATLAVMRVAAPRASEAVW